MLALEMGWSNSSFAKLAQQVKNSPAMKETQETWVLSLGWKDTLEGEIATHSNILAWKSPGQRSLMGYRLWGHKRVGHDLATEHTHRHWHILM